MSDNSLENAVFDQHIRELAYYSWQAAGSPDGMDLEHWHLAQHLMLRSQDTPGISASTQIHYEGGISAQPPSTTEPLIHLAAATSK